MSIGSDVDLVNLALSHIGDAAQVTNISPSDGSAQADHAARFYAQVRDALLERFAWKFALRRAALAERADLSVGSWAHIYAEPNGCLRVLAILPGSYTSDSQAVRFATESDEDGAPLILTDADAAACRYIARVTDPARFSPGFVDTFAWSLAAVLAGPIIKGETGRAEAIRCYQAASLAYAGATGLSATQSKQALDFIPSTISARGGAVDTSSEFTDVIGDTGGFPIRGS